MAKKKKGNIPYRNVHPDIWTDAKVQSFSDLQFRFFIFSFSSPKAAATNFGIYEVTRGEIAMYMNCRMEDVDLLIDFFNKKHLKIIQYDAENHIIFCKNFTKYQGDYLSTWKGFIPKLLHDWERTREKVPHFWQEFYQKNEAKIKFMNELAKNDKDNPQNQNLDEFIQKNQIKKPIPNLETYDSTPDLFSGVGV